METNRILHAHVGDSHEDIGIEGGASYQFHFLSLTIIWAGAVNVGIIVYLFRHSVITYYIHAIIMWIACIFTFCGAFMQIVMGQGSIGNGA